MGASPSPSQPATTRAKTADVTTPSTAWRAITVAVVAPLAAALTGLYLFASNLGSGTDVLRYDSGAYDMDVPRVVSDWSGADSSHRITMHPLYQLAIAPIVRAVAGLLPGTGS